MKAANSLLKSANALSIASLAVSACAASSGIFIESPTLFPGEINILQSGEWWLGPGPNTLNMMVIVPNVSPTTTTGQDILVTVVSAGPTGYAPPFPGYEYPVDASLAAYQVWTAPIKDSQ